MERDGDGNVLEHYQNLQHDKEIYITNKFAAIDEAINKGETIVHLFIKDNYDPERVCYLINKYLEKYDTRQFKIRATMSDFQTQQSELYGPWCRYCLYPVSSAIEMIGYGWFEVKLYIEYNGIENEEEEEITRTSVYEKKILENPATFEYQLLKLDELIINGGKETSMYLKNYRTLGFNYPIYTAEYMSKIIHKYLSKYNEPKLKIKANVKAFHYNNWSNDLSDLICCMCCAKDCLYKKQIKVEVELYLDRF